MRRTTDTLTKPDEHADDVSGPDLLGALVRGAGGITTTPGLSIVVGRLLAIGEGGRTPLVLLPNNEPSVPVAARAILDLHGAHVGKDVVVCFADGDAARPIVLGVLRGEAAWPLESIPGQVEIDRDGERMIVSAKQQLVLRCGAASLTMSADGKVVIRGTSVISQAERVNRIRGGSVQIN
jgi:hypothetical protein